jgi:hypothetical protein
MIVIEQGTVVGKLDEETLALTDVISERLQELVDDWRRNGFEELGPAEISDHLEPPPVCATALVVIPFTTENLNFIENKLLIAGFDVQRD